MKGLRRQTPLTMYSKSENGWSDRGHTSWISAVGHTREPLSPRGRWSSRRRRRPRGQREHNPAALYARRAVTVVKTIIIIIIVIACPSH